MSTPSTGDDRVKAAADLMNAFLLDTGVVGDKPPRRYLWTDAFAVCNLLGLHAFDIGPDLEGADTYRSLALQLVDQVHHVLGRHRDDDPRDGWISDLEEDDGEKHPTAGGLRIGKPLPERGPDEPVDRSLEWSRDGQYFHYLTKWMHALRRVSAVEQDATYAGWAVELAKAAHRSFIHGSPRTGKQLYWKMSIDLSRPQVSAMGQHDALDGYLTYRTLMAPGAPFDGAPGTGLRREIADMAGMAGLDDGARWATHDPLGLGGLFTDAYRVGQLRSRGVAEAEGLLESLLVAADRGFPMFLGGRALEDPPGRRLPFRELGLSIGMHALERLVSLIDDGAIPGVSSGVGERLAHLLEARAIADRIEGTWVAEASRPADTWRAHADINTVMLATSLAPDGYLDL